MTAGRTGFSWLSASAYVPNTNHILHMYLIAYQTLAIAISPFLSLFTNLSQSEQRHVSAAKNLAQARREAREYGELRRAEIRKRVRSSEIDREYEELVAKKEKERSTRGDG